VDSLACSLVHITKIVILWHVVHTLIHFLPFVFAG
jgi:hypothetical protein